jgi:hypothetical protein
VHEILDFGVSVGQNQQAEGDALLLMAAVNNALVVLSRPGTLKKGSKGVVVLLGKEGRVVAKGVCEKLGGGLEEVFIGEAVDGRVN